MQTIIAINKTYQSKINRALKIWLRYDSLNDQRDIADGNGDEKSYKKFDRSCQSTFDKYLDIIDQLPKRERLNFEKAIQY
jgi:hypothetical protein